MKNLPKTSFFALAILISSLLVFSCTDIIDTENNKKIIPKDDQPLFDTSSCLTLTDVDFGKLKPGESKSYGYRLINNCDSLVVIYSILIEGIDASSFAFSGFPSLPFVIEPGNEFDMKIIFTGNKLGTNLAKVKINNSDSLTFNLKGEVIENPKPCLVIKDLDFGIVDAGSIKDTIIILTNTCSFDLEITSIRLIGSVKVFQFDSGNIPFIIKPSESFMLPVAFYPAGQGIFIDSIIINESPDLKFQIRGTSQINNPDCFSAPDVVFGSLNPGTTATKACNVRNDCNIQMSIKSIALSSLENCFMFDNVPSTPTVLQPGESMQLMIEFSPASQGTFTGKIIFDASLPLEIKLTGECK